MAAALIALGQLGLLAWRWQLLHRLLTGIEGLVIPLTGRLITRYGTAPLIVASMLGGPLTTTSCPRSASCPASRHSTGTAPDASQKANRYLIARAKYVAECAKGAYLS